MGGSEASHLDAKDDVERHRRQHRKVGIHRHLHGTQLYSIHEVASARK